MNLRSLVGVNLDWFWHFARHPAVDIAFSTDRIRGSQIDKRRLFQKTYGQMKLFRNSLGWDVALARPNNVFNIQAIVVGLVTLPHADLK